MRCLTATVLAVVCCVFAFSAGVSAYQPNGWSPQHYTQCDPRWANDHMGVPNSGQNITICDQGCAMTTLSMTLSGLGVTVGGALVTPKSLNAWLRANDGYLCLGGDCANLRLDAVHNLTNLVRVIGEPVTATSSLATYSALATALQSPYSSHVFCLLHVRNQSHFVLALEPSVTPQGIAGFNVYDPFFSATFYTFSDVHDVIMYKYNPAPLYKQCDNTSYSANEMGDIVNGHQYNQNGYTICDVGCLMSSCSSALAGSGIPLPGARPGQLPNPGTLNAFLGQVGGYVPNTADLDESALMKVNPNRVKWGSNSMFPKNTVPLTLIRQWLLQPVPRVVIANVMQGQHFVLVVGFDEKTDTLYINDSGFNRMTYSYTCKSSNDMGCVIGWRVFDMAPIVS